MSPLEKKQAEIKLGLLQRRRTNLVELIRLTTSAQIKCDAESDLELVEGEIREVEDSIQ